MRNPGRKLAYQHKDHAKQVRECLRLARASDCRLPMAMHTWVEPHVQAVLQEVECAIRGVSDGGSE